MKCDIKALVSGCALMALVPVLLLYQSSNTSKGTSGGVSEYNVDHLGSTATSYLYSGESKALDIFCDYALGRDGNGILAAAWIDHIAALRGEDFYVHLARGTSVRTARHTISRKLLRRNVLRLRQPHQSAAIARHKTSKMVLRTDVRWLHTPRTSPTTAGKKIERVLLLRNVPPMRQPSQSARTTRHGISPSLL